MGYSRIIFYCFNFCFIMDRILVDHKRELFNENVIFVRSSFADLILLTILTILRYDYYD